MPHKSMDRPADRAPRPAFIAALLLLIAVFAAYQHVPTFDFVDYDDHVNVIANPHYPPADVRDILFFWANPYYSLYTPLTSTVWSLASRLAALPGPTTRPSGDLTALAPDVFHWLNLAFHLGNVLLVFLLLRRLVGRGAPGDVPAAVGAALFGLHPLQAEPVAWVT